MVAGEAETIEGQGQMVNVVIKFETEEAVKGGFYNNPAYASIKQIRLGATTNGTVVFAEQFTA